jgi:hypothetical protein
MNNSIPFLRVIRAPSFYASLHITVLTKRRISGFQ